MKIKKKKDRKSKALRQQVSLLKLRVEAAELEADLQGEIIESYRRQVQNLLAALVHEGKRLGVKEPEILKGVK